MGPRQGFTGTFAPHNRGRRKEGILRLAPRGEVRERFLQKLRWGKGLVQAGRGGDVSAPARVKSMLLRAWHVYLTC